MPTIVVVTRDVVTFAVIAVSAAAIDGILERVRGDSAFFGDIRLVANLLLAFLAIVYLVEGVLFVLIDVAHAVKLRWEAKLGTDSVPAHAAEAADE